MAGGQTSRWHLHHPRYVLFIALLLSAAATLSQIIPIRESLLLGFDVAVAGFALSCAKLWLHGDAHVLRREARDNDAGRGLLLMLTLLIGAIVLVTLATLVLERAMIGAEIISLLVISLLASWLFVNLIFAFHYARLYFDTDDRVEGGDRGGLQFPGTVTPVFSDFVNFAFVIGMTSQTADIAITSHHMRRVATLQGLFAFIFNLGILALTVNVLASGGAGPGLSPPSTP